MNNEKQQTQNISRKLKSSRKTQTLGSLYYQLKERGMLQLFKRHQISNDNSCLHIVYLDYILDEQFITIIRTSSQCYRTYYNKELTCTRNIPDTINNLTKILEDILSQSKLYSVLTIKELIHFNKYDYTLRHSLIDRYNKLNPDKPIFY